MRPSIYLLAIGLLLAGCSDTNIPQPPALSFTRYQPIYMAVAKIDIVDEYKSPEQLPNVEHLIPYSPSEAMHLWVKDRLRAVGLDKSMQIIIKDASVVVAQLPKPGGMTGFFTISQDKRYDAKLDVELRIYGEENAMSLASIEVTANRSITIPVNASLAERDAAFRRMISSMMEGVNAELEKNIFQYFGAYVSYSHNP